MKPHPVSETPRQTSAVVTTTPRCRTSQLRSAASHPSHRTDRLTDCLLGFLFSHCGSLLRPGIAAQHEALLGTPLLLCLVHLDCVSSRGSYCEFAPISIVYLKLDMDLISDAFDTSCLGRIQCKSPVLLWFATLALFPFNPFSARLSFHLPEC